MLYTISHKVSNCTPTKKPLLSKDAMYVRYIEYIFCFDTDTMKTELVKIRYEEENYAHKLKVYNEELLKKMESIDNNFNGHLVKGCYANNISHTYIYEIIQIDKKTLKLLNYNEDIVISFNPYQSFIYEDKDEIYIKIINGKIEPVKCSLNLDNMEINFKDFEKVTYNTIIINMYKEHGGIQLLDENNNEIKILKKNIWKFFEYYDFVYLPSLKNDCIRYYVTQYNNKKIKYILWEIHKNHTADVARTFEILHKAGYDNILSHAIDTKYELDMTGSNPQKILRLSKNALKFLKINEKKLVTYSINSFNSFKLESIKALEDKHGPNFTYLFDLHENLSQELDKIKVNDYVIDTCMFTQIDEFELLHKYNYTKNNKNLAVYIKDTLPERQGILSLFEAKNFFLQYLKLIDDLDVKDFIKYPDSLVKEIALLKKTKITRVSKEKSQVKEKLINIKKELFERKYEDFIFIPLLTQEDLFSESSKMNNCVRSYTNTLYNLNNICISMRTLDGKSICTLELRNHNMKNVTFLNDLEDNGIEILTPNFKNVQFLQKRNHMSTVEQRKVANRYIKDINDTIANLKSNKHIPEEMKVAIEQ